jgi:crotonobetainyl-CoA:carnitine CoA-transferase CaiB-like acyl-CoA transferase
VTPEGHPYIPEHPSMGIHAGPLFGALGVLAGHHPGPAETGVGCRMEIAQSDAAAAMDWLRSETYKSYERPESEVTGNKSDGYERVRRARGQGRAASATRSTTRPTAGVCSWRAEREFWKNFCEGIGRPELFEAIPEPVRRTTPAATLELPTSWPPSSRPAPPASGSSSARRPTRRIAPVNTPQTIADDPQFQDRMPWLPAADHGIDMLPSPIKLLDEELPPPSKAPTVGRAHRRRAADVLGWDDDRIAEVRSSGALG